MELWWGKTADLMPSFRDPEDGGVWVWDAATKTYVKVEAQDKTTDRSHSSGGDNELFDPATQTEWQGVPELEGHMAANWPTSEAPGHHEADPGGWMPRGRGELDPFESICPHCGNPTYHELDFRARCEHCGELLHAMPDEDRYSASYSETDHAPRGMVVCPNCRTKTDMPQCPACGKGLQPEWNREEGDVKGFEDAQPRSEASEFYSLPERVPKRNREKTDDSYPSMLSVGRVAAFMWRTADWDLDDEGLYGVARTEVGKWLEDISGQMHTGPAQQNHEVIAKGVGLRWPQDVGAAGSVYYDGHADVQYSSPNYSLDLARTQGVLQRIFGDVTLQGPTPQAQQKGDVFAPIEIRGGTWLVRGLAAQQPVTGTAWVKEKPEGVQYQPHMVLVADHLTPDDFHLYALGPAAIVTATGGSTSHAAQLAVENGWPVVAGIGPENYSKIETGNYLKIDAAGLTAPPKSITVIPVAQNPEQNRDVWDTVVRHQRGTELAYPQAYPQMPAAFAHAIEEEEWLAKHAADLDSCPECGGPMVDKGGERVCHDCGHRQPIVYASRKEAFLPALMALLPELGAGAAEAGGAAGAAEGAGAAGGGMGGMMGGGGMSPMSVLNIGSMMSRVMGGGPSGNASVAQPTQPVAPGAAGAGVYTHFLYADTFGEEETGRATKNRGEDSDPDHHGSGMNPEEQGDSPEQLKGVDGNVGAKSAIYDDPSQWSDAQRDAVKVFEVNFPLIEQFKDGGGAAHPIVKAIDAMMEEAFPGYKELGEDGKTDAEAANDVLEHAATDDDVEDTGEDWAAVAPGLHHPKAAATVWHSGFEVDMPKEAADMYTGPASEVNVVPGAGTAPTCPICHQSHIPGTPCPTVPQQDQPVQQPATGQVPLQGMMAQPNTQPKVVTKTVRGRWEDSEGHPLKEGSTYELRSEGYAIPDRVRIDKVLPDKVVYTIESGGVKYRDQLTAKEVRTGGYTFERGTDAPDSATEDLGDYTAASWGPPTATAPDFSVRRDRPGELYAGIPCAICHEPLKETDEPAETEHGLVHAQHVHEMGLTTAAVDIDPVYRQRGEPGPFGMSDEDARADLDTRAFQEQYDPEWEAAARQWTDEDVLELLNSTGKLSPEGMEFVRQEAARRGLEHGPYHSPEEAPPYAPVRPGQDPTPQVDDLSEPPTRVSTLSPSGYGSSHETCPKCGTAMRPGSYVCSPLDGGCGWRDFAAGRSQNPGMSNADVVQYQGGEGLPRGQFHPPGDPRRHQGSDDFAGNAGPLDPTVTPEQAAAVAEMMARAAADSGEADGMPKFAGDDPAARAYLMEGNPGSGVDVDPQLMAKLAGRDFSPREQREFIDEDGEARNLGKLDLAGTHYVFDDSDPELSLW
jgi:phosphohistidine swiveling domain-containing protein